MATMNLQKYIALFNTLAKPEERVPLYIMMNNRGESTDLPHLDKLFKKLQSYLEGIRVFGQEPGRLEDGYGERTYHETDVAQLIAYLSRLGFERCVRMFGESFPEENGWYYPELVTKEIVDDISGETKNYREIFIGEDSLDEIGKPVFDPNVEGGKGSGYVDVVGWDGKIIRKCRLLRISDLHPDAVRTVKQYAIDETTGKEKTVDVQQPVPGIKSELWLVVTPECDSEGWVKISAEDGYILNDGDGPDDLTLKSSPYLRTPLSFFAMRKHQPNDKEEGPFPKGTMLAASNCPSHVKLKDFDEATALMSYFVSDVNTVGILAKTMSTIFSGQVYVTEENEKAFHKQMAYLTDEKDPGTKKWRKEWLKLLGQYHFIVPTYEVGDRLFNTKPRPTARNRFVGIDATAELCQVVDLQFNRFWAIIPEFAFIHNPRGVLAGTEACTAPEPKASIIKVLVDPKNNKWEEHPIVNFPFVDTRGSVTFHRDGVSVEDYLANNKLKAIPKFKPLPDILEHLKAEKKRQEKESAKIKAKK